MARSLVLDANILVRAVLGRRVLELLETYSDRVHFVAPETAYSDVRVYLPEILTKRGLPLATVTTLIDDVLARLPGLVNPVPYEVYAGSEEDARQRMSGRDEADWPFVALAITLNCPVWTEDRDFFGSGVPTWTTDRVEVYLRDGPRTSRVAP